MKLRNIDKMKIALKMIKGRKIDDVELQAEILLTLDNFELSGRTVEEEEEMLRDSIISTIRRYKAEHSNIHCECGHLTGEETFGMKCRICDTVSTRRKKPVEGDHSYHWDHEGYPNEIPYGIDIGFLNLLGYVEKYL